ncbi:MAG: hypothetical protein IT440_07480 [Phycisphaeraceae bacterium]|nr:hypothetical protein [Phycisphaeraceae bacterium]
MLDDTYDVVDRIVINAYFNLACSPGGFRQWWYNLHGTLDHLDDTHLMRMAGRFSRRVRGWAKKNNIPVIDCKDGDRKHRIAQQYIPSDPTFRGIFAVMVARMPSPVWRVLRFDSGGFHLKRKEPMPFTNHYFFHIMDAQWGHVTVMLCGHPPFKGTVMLNGHEYTASLARRRGIGFTKDGNCFVEMTDSRQLTEAADALRSKAAIGQLRQVCERWIYRCVCFGLSFDEQKRTGFRYTYSVYQVEYSRNLLFRNGRQMERVFDGMIDRTRRLLDIRRVLKIFGRRNRRYKRFGPSAREQVVVETPEYDLTVFKLHFGKLTLKLYTKGECVLRSEAISHNVKELGCGRIIDRFNDIVNRLSELLENFLNALQCVDTAWVRDGQLDDLPTPGQVGRTRVGGVDVNRPRTRAAMEATIALALKPGGFTAAEHADHVRRLLGAEGLRYTSRQSAYDLKKLRGKGLIDKTHPRSRCYCVTSIGLRTMTGLIVLREKIIKPLLSNLGRCRSGPPAHKSSKLDVCYRQLQHGMQDLFRQLHFVEHDTMSNVLSM